MGTLKADILAPEDGDMTGIDCLRLNRLARMAGAPIDKGAGIRILKKIGDRVEKGEPIYRIHAFETSEFELAVGAAKIDDRLPNRRQASRRQRVDRCEQRCHPLFSREASRCQPIGQLA